MTETATYRKLYLYIISKFLAKYILVSVIYHSLHTLFFFITLFFRYTQFFELCIDKINFIGYTGICEYY